MIDFNKFECPICNNYLFPGMNIDNTFYCHCKHCKHFKIVISYNKDNFIITKMLDYKNDISALSNEKFSTIYSDDDSSIEVEYEQNFSKVEDLQIFYKYVKKVTENMVFA